MKAIAIPLVALVLIVLASIVYASPQGGQIWSEEPWTGEANNSDNSAQALKETTLSDPVTFNLSGNEPRFIQIGLDQYNYSDYVSDPRSLSAFPELWIRKGDVWSRYDDVTAGEGVDLIVHTPKDGSADLYLISYANSSIAHWSFKTMKDYYHRLNLVPEETGRLFLLLSQGNEPGDALILDVLARQAESSLPDSVLNVNDVRIGEALITVRSERIKGYDVYVDGVFFSSDISDGSLDGVASFTVGGEKVHTITVYQRDFQGAIINKSEHTKSFKRDIAYTLWIT